MMEDVTFISVLQDYDDSISELTREYSQTSEHIKVIRSVSPKVTAKEIELTEHLTVIGDAIKGYQAGKNKVLSRFHKAIENELMAKRLRLRHVPLMATKWGVHNA